MNYYYYYMRKEDLDHLFKIDQVAYLTLSELNNNDDKIKYLKIFKKEISLEDFDKFCSGSIHKDLKKKILNEIYDINADTITFYINTQSIKRYRENNKAFNRSLKLKLLFQ